MRGALLTIGFVLIGPWAAFSDGAILSDFSLRNEPQELALINTSDRKCSSTVKLFHQCGFKYEFNGETVKQNYAMFAFGAPKTVLLLRGTETGRITSTVGQEYFWNRVFTITFLLFISAFTLLILLRMFLSMGKGLQRVPVSHAQPYHNTGNNGGNQNGASFGRRTGF